MEPTTLTSDVSRLVFYQGIAQQNIDLVKKTTQDIKQIFDTCRQSFESSSRTMYIMGGIGMAVSVGIYGWALTRAIMPPHDDHNRMMTSCNGVLLLSGVLWGRAMGRSDVAPRMFPIEKFQQLMEYFSKIESANKKSDDLLNKLVENVQAADLVEVLEYQS